MRAQLDEIGLVKDTAAASTVESSPQLIITPYKASAPIRSKELPQLCQSRLANRDGKHRRQAGLELLF